MQKGRVLMINDDIIKIIKRGINEQQVLLTELTRLGYSITQSSISRKLKKMGIAKIGGKYKLPKSEESKIKNITFIEPNMVVVHTLPGHANAIGAVIDEELVGSPKHSEFVGTIAGDDTIFVAIDDGIYPRVMSALKNLLNIN